MAKSEITVEPEDGGFRLYVTSYGRKMPAGARLLRNNPPYIAFSHATRERADKDCAALQLYLNSLDTAKPSKTEARKHAAEFR